MENKSYIWITTQKEGYHFWESAPEEVGFLRYPHRHIFGFRVYIQVEHNDREIEFFMFKNNVDKLINNIWETYNLDKYDKADRVSCEMISDNLNDLVNQLYPQRDTIIEVDEDKQVGNKKEYNNHNI